MFAAFCFTTIVTLADTSTIHTDVNSATRGTPNAGCPQFQIYGYPSISDTEILLRSFYTCRKGYASLYDPAERTPLWVAEHLQKGNFSGHAERDLIDFIPDPDIPYWYLPFPEDYKGSGYDKGHLAAAANFRSSQAAMNATFRFANAVPQTPQSNRGVWKQLEDATRMLAIRRGGLFVVTGPVYSSIPRTKIKNRVSVPDALYKVLIDPKSETMTGFVIPNTPDVKSDFRLYQVKVREIEKLTGIDFNPNLPHAKADALETHNGGDWPMPGTDRKPSR